MSEATLEEKRAARKAALAEAKAAQYALDLVELDALEVAYGDECVVEMKVGGYVEGLPTIIVVKSPGNSALYKRYTDMVRKAGKDIEAIGKAQDVLGDSCIVYPSDPDTRKKMFEAFPGAKISASLAAVKFVELEDSAAKKG